MNYVVALLISVVVGYVPTTDGRYAVPGPEVVSVALVDGSLEVVWRQRSNMQLMVNPPQPAPDTVWKEVYVCGEGEVVLGSRVSGKHVPASGVPERFIFQDAVKEDE